MSSEDPPMFGPGPLTLENAEQWLNWLENMAVHERDAGYATRLVQLALFAELVKKGIIDGDRFIADLAAVSPRLEHEGYRLALRQRLDDLAEQLALLRRAASEPGRSH